MRQHEQQRPDDVRRRCEQHLAFLERLAHQVEVEVLEVTQAAVHELGAGRGRVRGEVVLLAEHDLQSASRGIARDPGAVDAATDDEEVAVAHR